MFRNDILWTNRKQATLDQHVVIYEENNYDCKPSCYHFYILVSLRSLLWTFLSISAAILVVSSTLTPDWLIAPPTALSISSIDSNSSGFKTAWIRQTIGLIYQCSAKVQSGKLVEFCNPVHANVNWAWKSCILLLGASSLLLTVTAISSVISICVKSICRKSIFTLTGLVQSIAGKKCFLLLKRELCKLLLRCMQSMEFFRFAAAADFDKAIFLWFYLSLRKISRKLIHCYYKLMRNISNRL